ncbi:uncharacterized protein LOC125031580 [Penaeus chinensis]|uniref:uncharacterized protein LOC125031580 n=1 Tax=Penaeus chinensis TaxID=139456 RepID=UPI001FB6DEF0|nr:uncharacterized protein LOC125031580 [Penaeus chinensis]XP_047478428.1 uncharacterized protein LOC125031580 [Penaeus chinensis]XP_047478433.1 uncharacterized protein LOC125031580 [Penaeus chinensis]
MRKFGRSIIVLIFFAVYISITNGEIATKCKYSTDCRVEEICINDHCQCPHIEYSKRHYSMCSPVNEYDICRFITYCGRNSKCINHRCVCDEGYYWVTSACRKVQVQPVMGPCRETSLALWSTQAIWLCDDRKHSVCINKICVCVKGYVPNSDGLCKPQESYMKNYSLSEYRVKPGEYCRDSANCIEGLECEEFKCRCPTDCSYDQRKEACDCGKVDLEMGPVLLGGFLGLLVILFWCRRIKRTIRKHKEMMRPTDNNEYVPPSYALSPVHSSIQTETSVDGTASPASRTAGTPIPEDTGTSATSYLNPPRAPNNPLKPESDKPPSYMEMISSPPPSYIEVISSPLYNPDPRSQPLTFIPNAPYPHGYIPLSSSTQQSSSPSHSLSGRPHSRSSSPVPDNSSPSATTYPMNPSAAPHPGSLNAVLQPDNSSAPAGATSSSSPSHSVPEAPPAYNPYFKNDNAPGTSDNDSKLKY